MVWRENLMACQFHPEKSQQVGLAMYANFAAFEALVIYGFRQRSGSYSDFAGAAVIRAPMMSMEACSLPAG